MIQHIERDAAIRDRAEWQRRLDRWVEESAAELVALMATDFEHKIGPRRMEGFPAYAEVTSDAARWIEALRMEVKQGFDRWFMERGKTSSRAEEFPNGCGV